MTGLRTARRKDRGLIVIVVKTVPRCTQKLCQALIFFFTESYFRGVKRPCPEAWRLDSTHSVLSIRMRWARASIYIYKKVKKVKFTLLQASWPWRGGRGIALPILNLGTRREWVVSTTPWPRERPGTHCIGGWVGPRAGLDVCEKSRPHRVFL
jgi:hypothetical protein